MIAGGSEAAITPEGLVGFTRLRALASSFNDPELASKASRPFDAKREGFVMGEGSGVMVLEEYRHAIGRGARVYAEIAGYGTSCDAHHVTAPREDGSGARRAMQNALRNGNVSDNAEIGYINAHATSTPLGDEAERRAIAVEFDRTNTLVSSTKGATGHLLGAAGAVEAVFTALAVHHQVVPPTVNTAELENDSGAFQLVCEMPKKAELQAALSNSFAFGGTNVSLLFRKWH
uniref:beta-ketoacyl-[acyl-carrier-protein] synthase I n=1 Tax=Timspurckia oligopyrenoides TaxID=708627 RepID=A0A7S0ZH64_9RHOD